MENRNRQVLLKRRPTGSPTPADFGGRASAIPVASIQLVLTRLVTA